MRFKRTEKKVHLYSYSRRLFSILFLFLSLPCVKASAAQGNYLNRFQNFTLSFEDDVTRYGQTPWRYGLRANGVDPMIYFHKDQPGNALKGTAGFDINIDGLKPWVENKARIETSFLYGDSHIRVPLKKAEIAGGVDNANLIDDQAKDLGGPFGTFPFTADSDFSFNQIMREGDTLIYLPHQISTHTFEPFIGMAWASVDRGYFMRMPETGNPADGRFDLNEKTKARYLGAEAGATLNLAMTQDFRIYVESAYYLYHADSQFSGQEDIFSGTTKYEPHNVRQTKNLTTYRVRLKTGLGYDFKFIQADVSWQWDYWDYAPEIVNPLHGDTSTGASFDPAAYIKGNAVRDWSVNFKLSKRF